MAPYPPSSWGPLHIPNRDPVIWLCRAKRAELQSKWAYRHRYKYRHKEKSCQCWNNSICICISLAWPSSCVAAGHTYACPWHGMPYTYYARASARDPHSVYIAVRAACSHHLDLEENIAVWSHHVLNFTINPPLRTTTACDAVCRAKPVIVQPYQQKK